MPPKLAQPPTWIDDWEEGELAEVEMLVVLYGDRVKLPEDQDTRNKKLDTE